ncbi:uncharacterized protein N7500_001508 [Penicillium coprophilum]|uniref:uncharacterized protein n=1 Tax=Penicillium coprophilum TaxID=36646 RepID=UPI00239BEDEF|nr:uncharacterized protein N7500_001508 [Penicillium coprophilum]KAJ5173577.1 hypothetical protein N7500_001508 [Penicillium coprophilum]
MKVSGSMEPALRRCYGTDKVRIFKPLLRAYALGYLSSITPKLLSYVRQLRNKNWTAQQKLQELVKVLTGPFRLSSFPTACASLVGGSTLLPIGLYRLCALITAALSKGDVQISQKLDRLIRFVITFLSGWFSFQLLNRNRICLPIEDVTAIRNSTDQEQDPGQVMANPLEHHRPELAGRTMDLTIYMVTRAVDAVACVAWGRWSRRRHAQNRWTTVESLVPGFADAAGFAMSASVVMWAWFYLPERLPKTYEKWIREAAQVDSRLIEALRRVRRGVFVYGKDTGQAPLLQSMCKDYSWPEVWGDPAKVTPIPCEMVHMGCGPSCEKHALYRFAKTFKFACATYIPLQIVFRLRRMKSAIALRRALSDTAQSSAFLASFVSLFYYGVCLARTRLGPKIFDAKTITPMMWDSGLCVGAGCLMCGWSILVEKARKRQELVLFVAPRAAATVLPRLYDKKYQYRERVAFAISAAILMTCLRERPRMRFGTMLSRLIPSLGRSALTGTIPQRSIYLQKSVFEVERRYFSRNFSVHEQRNSSAAPFNTPESQKRNTSTMYYTISMILGTVALAYGSVPLYKMICQQTGWGGQPILTHRIGDGDTSARVTPVTDSRRLRITFNGSVSDVLPWKFTPQQREVRVLPGETALAFYTATNKGPNDIIGVATYSVTPGQVAPYFSKIQCFCFEEQKLNAGESVDMPVFFFIDPDFATDPNMQGIDTITLSYTFFKAKYDDNGVLTPIAS